MVQRGVASYLEKKKNGPGSIKTYDSTRECICHFFGLFPVTYKLKTIGTGEYATCALAAILVHPAQVRAKGSTFANSIMIGEYPVRS